jgi:hypothetical protein
MKPALKIVVYCVLGAILAVFGLWVADYGLKKTEQLECEQWRQYENDYPYFYWTGWQTEQCK